MKIPMNRMKTINTASRWGSPYPYKLGDQALEDIGDDEAGNEGRKNTSEKEDEQKEADEHQQYNNRLFIGKVPGHEAVEHLNHARLPMMCPGRAG